MGLFHPFRDYHRKGLAEQPFPAEWSAIIARNVPYCEGMTEGQVFWTGNLI